LAWHNDADYEAIRDPKFVEQLNVFQTLPEVQTYLEQLPKPKGTNKFFVDMYGEPDGLEELKYGHLAEWPLTPVNTDRVSRWYSKGVQFTGISIETAECESVG